MKVLFTALVIFCCTGVTIAQDFEKDADAVYQKLKQRAQKNGFRKFLIFNQGVPAFNAEPGTEYRIAFLYDVRKSDTLRAVLHEQAAGQDKVVIPSQVTDGPREGVAGSSIFYYTTPDYKEGPIPVKLDVFPMGIVYVYKKKR